MLEHIAHVVKVEIPLAAGGVVGLHGVAHGLVSGQIHPEAALRPQQGLDDPVDIVHIRIKPLRGAVDFRAVDGHLTAGALHSHIKGFCGIGQEAFVEPAQRNELRIQRGQMFYGNVDSKMFHNNSSHNDNFHLLAKCVFRF